MIVLNYEEEVLKEKKYLYKALGINIHKKNIISFVGAGGKTTSIYRLAKELSNIGKKVIVTTTTHMEAPKELVLSDINELKNKLKYGNLITVGTLTKYNKITSLEYEKLIQIINFCDFLLVEADGSKKLPLKAPALHEPVILRGSNMVIGVAGIDSIGKSIKSTCHRPEIVSKVLNVNDEHLITFKDIAYMLSSEEGQLKNVLQDNESHGDIQYRAIINKVDNIELLNSAKLISDELKCKGIDSTITTYVDELFHMRG